MYCILLQYCDRVIELRYSAPMKTLMTDTARIVSDGIFISGWKAISGRTDFTAKSWVLETRLWYTNN